MMKNKKSLVKKIGIAGLAVSAMSLTTVSFAVGAPGGGGIDSAMIVAAINSFDQNVQNINIQHIKRKNSDDYQDPQTQIQTAEVNPLKQQAQVQEYPDSTGISAIGQKEAGGFTENLNKNSLLAFSDSALTYNTTTSAVEAAIARNKKRAGEINEYSWLTKASDSLYTYLGDGNPDTQKPTDLHNNYFNFSVLIDPMDYTPAQENNAKHLITYLSEQYQPLSSNINFDQFRAYLKGLKPAKVSDALKSLATSNVYEQYQLVARQLISDRSVALNNFNELITERSPIRTAQPSGELDTLSREIGITPTTAKDPKTDKTVYLYASPLQISNYVTTHRTGSKEWYQQMMAASPATVKRETLFVLAEMETEMQRQHLDNERILATLSASEMEAATGQYNTLRAMSNDVNTEINNLVSSNGQSVVQPINGPNSGNGPGFGFGGGNTSPTSLNPPGKK